MDPRELLAAVAHHGASDLHCRPGSPPAIRVGGDLRVLDGAAPFEASQVAALASAWLGPRLETLHATGSVIGAHSEPGVGRFRISAYLQRGTIGVVVHGVRDQPASIEDLGAPTALHTMVEARSGLALIAAGTGQGATSTLAAVVDHVNATRPAHVLTVEDPIETLHRNQVAMVSQLEVGSDVPTVAAGVRMGARVDADVVVVGAITDRETAQACLDSAAAGRLVVGVLRADSVVDAALGFGEFFGISERAVARRALARAAVGIVAQRLLPAATGRRRVLASEVLVATAKTSACLGDESRYGDLPALLADGAYNGMRTLDQHLIDLVRAGEIETETALHHAVDPEDMRIALLAR